MIVIDCSVVVDLLVHDPELAEHLGAGHLHAPQHLDVEVVSAFRGLRLGGHLSHGRAVDALTDYHDLPVRRWPVAHHLAVRMLQWGDNLTAYDAAYVALAEALECSLLTRDRRLAAAAGRLIQVAVV